MAAPIDPPAPNTSVRFPFKLDELTTIASYFLAGAWPAPVFKTTDERQWRKRTPWTTRAFSAHTNPLQLSRIRRMDSPPLLFCPARSVGKNPVLPPGRVDLGSAAQFWTAAVSLLISGVQPGDAATRRQRVMKTETSAVNVAKAHIEAWSSH